MANRRVRLRKAVNAPPRARLLKVEGVMKHQWISVAGLFATIAFCGYIVAQLHSERQQAASKGDVRHSITQGMPAGTAGP